MLVIGLKPCDLILSIPGNDIAPPVVQIPERPPPGYSVGVLDEITTTSFSVRLSFPLKKL